MRIARSLVLVLIPSLLAGACTSINADFEEVNGRRYIVASVTKPADEFVVVSVVSREDESAATVRRSRRRFAEAAQPRLVAECRRKGGVPTTRGVIPGFVSQFVNDGPNTGWTFVRNCA